MLRVCRQLLLYVLLRNHSCFQRQSQYRLTAHLMYFFIMIIKWRIEKYTSISLDYVCKSIKRINHFNAFSLLAIYLEKSSRRDLGAEPPRKKKFEWLKIIKFSYLEGKPSLFLPSLAWGFLSLWSQVTYIEVQLQNAELVRTCYVISTLQKWISEISRLSTADQWKILN